MLVVLILVVLSSYGERECLEHNRFTKTSVTMNEWEVLLVTVSAVIIGRVAERFKLPEQGCMELGQGQIKGDTPRWWMFRVTAMADINFTLSDFLQSQTRLKEYHEFHRQFPAIRKNSYRDFASKKRWRFL